MCPVLVLGTVLGPHYCSILSVFSPPGSKALLPAFARDPDGEEHKVPVPTGAIDVAMGRWVPAAGTGGQLAASPCPAEPAAWLQATVPRVLRAWPGSYGTPGSFSASPLGQGHGAVPCSSPAPRAWCRSHRDRVHEEGACQRRGLVERAVRSRAGPNAARDARCGCISGWGTGITSPSCRSAVPRVPGHPPARVPVQCRGCPCQDNPVAAEVWAWQLWG